MSDKIIFIVWGICCYFIGVWNGRITAREKEGK
jgi:uncharacterized membrane protein YiaA